MKSGGAIEALPWAAFGRPRPGGGRRPPLTPPSKGGGSVGRAAARCKGGPEAPLRFLIITSDKLRPGALGRNCRGPPYLISKLMPARARDLPTPGREFKNSAKRYLGNIPGKRRPGARKIPFFPFIQKIKIN